MKCQDVRRAFPLLVEGEMPLTEWAILETHLVGCAECRKELEQQRIQAKQRARRRSRRATAAFVAATAALLGVTGGGIYLYEAGLFEAQRPDSSQSAPPRPMTVTPEAPVPPPPAPASPAPPVVPPSRPAVTSPPAVPSTQPVPAAPKAKTGVETPRP